MTRSLLISLPILFLASFTLSILTACETASQITAETAHADSHAHDEPRPYDSGQDALRDVENIIAAAKADDKLALVVMGANWCHDSRGLAAQFEKERFKSGILNDYYKLLYVDVGQKDRNINIANRFGLETIEGTPTVFIVDGDGTVLNLDTAPTWRNAASRHEDDIAKYFEDYGIASLK